MPSTLLMELEVLKMVVFLFFNYLFSIDNWMMICCQKCFLKTNISIIFITEEKNVFQLCYILYSLVWTVYSSQYTDTSASSLVCVHNSESPRGHKTVP